jgi:hypothetical protein
MGVFFTMGVATALLTRVWSFSTFEPFVNGTNRTKYNASTANTTAPPPPPHTLEYAISDLTEGLLGGAFALLAMLAFLIFVVAICAAGCLYACANVGRTSREIERAWFRDRGVVPHPVHHGQNGARAAQARPRHELLDRIAGVGERAGGFGGPARRPGAAPEGDEYRRAVPVAVRAGAASGAGDRARAD